MPISFVDPTCSALVPFVCRCMSVESCRNLLYLVVPFPICRSISACQLLVPSIHSTMSSQICTYLLTPCLIPYTSASDPSSNVGTSPFTSSKPIHRSGHSGEHNPPPHLPQRRSRIRVCHSAASASLICEILCLSNNGGYTGLLVDPYIVDEHDCVDEVGLSLHQQLSKQKPDTRIGTGGERARSNAPDLRFEIGKCPGSN